jgi:3-hydroxybutyryl-CoA dehydrogenase
MNDAGHIRRLVLVQGNNRLTFSIALCLARAGESVLLHTPEPQMALSYLSVYPRAENEIGFSDRISIISTLEEACDASLAIIICPEILEVKLQAIKSLEAILSPLSIITVNSESIDLSCLQKGSLSPERIIGLNWVEPAHTTCFLEIITNQTTNRDLVEQLRQRAIDRWSKDPYIIEGETGIRTQLFSAMAREAFYLVSEGYASMEDIDRACRNDAGYYLPFAGNLRYMDLMGTYAYGMVMKDLNPELATSSGTPSFFNELIKRGENGMEDGKGFYQYGEDESKKWEALLRRFSEQVSELVSKYPFNYKIEEVG